MSRSRTARTCMHMESWTVHAVTAATISTRRDRRARRRRPVTQMQRMCAPAISAIPIAPAGRRQRLHRLLPADRRSILDNGDRDQSQIQTRSILDHGAGRPRREHCFSLQQLASDHPLDRPRPEGVRLKLPLRAVPWLVGKEQRSVDELDEEPVVVGATTTTTSVPRKLAGCRGRVHGRATDAISTSRGRNGSIIVRPGHWADGAFHVDKEAGQPSPRYRPALAVDGERWTSAKSKRKKRTIFHFGWSPCLHRLILIE